MAGVLFPEGTIVPDLRREMVGTSYLVLPNGEPTHAAVVVTHEVHGLNANVRDICHRFAEQGYAALGVDLFAGRSKPICMARIFIDWLAGRLDSFAIGDLKEAMAQLSRRPEIDNNRIGAVGFCLGGTLALTWACTDGRLKAIGPYYGSAPRRREALNRLCPVVGSWPEKDFTTSAAATLETELSRAGVAHDLKVYPGARHAFFNDREDTYDATAAADSWQRVLAFFDEHVRAQRIPT
jgi:carboxymethylenebutenolidase